MFTDEERNARREEYLEYFGDLFIPKGMVVNCFLYHYDEERELYLDRIEVVYGHNPSEFSALAIVGAAVASDHPLDDDFTELVMKSFNVAYEGAEDTGYRLEWEQIAADHYRELGNYNIVIVHQKEVEDE